MGVKRIKRIAGTHLQRIKREHLRLYPLCVACEAKGKVALATQLDHIVSLARGGTDFDVDGGTNRQGLCVPCHEDKTAKDLGYRVRPRIGPDGFPVDGD